MLVSMTIGCGSLGYRGLSMQVGLDFLPNRKSEILGRKASHNIKVATAEG